MTTDKDHAATPALPQPDTYHTNGQVQYGAPGMTLRDYFAAKIMAASVSRYEYDSRQAFDAAKESYFLADAMMEARK